MIDNRPGNGERASSLILTIGMGAINNGALAAARLIIPLVGLGLGASTFLVGLISSLITLAPMLLSIRYGRWVDRIGSLVPMLFGTSLVVSSSLIFLAMPTAFGLLMLAPVIGAGAIFSHLATTRAIGTMSAEGNRARNLGYLVFGNSIFQFLSPLLASFLYEHFGAMAAVTTLGASGLLTLACMALPFHAYTRELGQAGGGAPGKSALDLLSIRELRRWVIVNSIFSATVTVYPLVISLHALNSGLAPSQAGLCLGGFALGTFVLRALIPALTRFISQPVAIGVALLVGGAIFVVFPYVTDFYALVAVSALLGMSIGSCWSMGIGLLYGSAPQGRQNEATGMGLAASNLLQTVTPFVAGIIASGLSIAPMAWILTAGLWVSATLSLRAERR